MPFEQAGPALIRVGIIPLLVIGAFIALRRRSWGLAYLAATGIWSLPMAAFVQTSNPHQDGRILVIATAIALFALLAGLGCVASGLRGWQRGAAVLAVLLLTVLPTALPRTVSGVQLASAGFVISQPSTDGSDYPFVGRSLLHGELEKNWDFYQWLARSLPLEARLLTAHPSAVASIAGVVSPTSGRNVQVLASWITPVYEERRCGSCTVTI